MPEFSAVENSYSNEDYNKKPGQDLFTWNVLYSWERHQKTTWKLE